MPAATFHYRAVGADGKPRTGIITAENPGSVTRELLRQGLTPVYVGANALEVPETGTTVRVRDGKRGVQDGPYADTKEQLAGFIILELASVDDALEWAARCPGASIGAVEVRPLAPEAMRRGFTG